MNMKLLKSLLALLIFSASLHAEQKITVTGFVYDRVTTKDLPKVKVTIISQDSTAVAETETGDFVYSPVGDPFRKYPLGNFRFEIPKISVPYTLRMLREGYEPYEMPLDLSTISSREYTMKLPAVYLTPETTRPTVELDELVVKTSKIKFYHKGDTIVYNADAFMLPQGSTLDALIAQLPGVEIKEGGKIYVNGKYVESLLLNGKDFFKGNQDVLRQNIGAYTVKDIAVYDKYGNLSKLLDSQLEDDKEYVMDVRLKKDYMGGYIGNLEGSYGTDDRYSGRLFAMHFNNNARFTLYGNINNVNNTNRPNNGQGSVMYYGMNQNGISDIANGGFDYYVEDPLKVWSINGNIDAKYLTNTLNKNIFSESFLQRNSYQTTFNNSHDKSLTLFTNHELKLNKGLYYFIFKPEFRYNRTRSTSDNSSVEFDTDIQERYDINQKVIDALYTGTSQDLREAIINRNRYNRTHRSNNYRGYFWSEQDFGFKGSPDAIGIWIEGEYNRDHSKSLTDQQIDYGFNGINSPATSIAYRRKNNQHPDYTGWMKGAIRYYLKVPNGQYSLGYEFRHEEQRKSSMEFLYDSRAEDEEANLPDTELHPDLGNTRSSKQHFNVHMIKASLEYNLKVASELMLTVVFSPEFHIRARTLYYNAYDLDDEGYYPVTIPVRRTSSSFNNSSARLVLNSSDRKHRCSVSYNFNTVYASMIDLIDIPNTSDPLNIYRGNPNLKDAFSQYVDFQYSLYPAKNTSYSLYSSLRYYSRDLMKGYSYDTQTGIRDFQTVNVSGNLATGVYAFFYKSIPLGNHEITLRANGEYGFNRYANMIGEDGPMRKQVVYSNSFGYTAEAGYTFNGKYTVGGRFYSLNMFSRTNSDVRANTVERRFTPQMWMNLKLPFNISFNATMNYIIIKGMDNRGMDPNHCLLNANLSYQLNDNWSFKVEGYDILNQQKPYTNVISAAGRTQTIVNALPRYVMLTVGYKFNTKKK